MIKFTQASGLKMVLVLVEIKKQVPSDLFMCREHLGLSQLIVSGYYACHGPESYH